MPDKKSARPHSTAMTRQQRYRIRLYKAGKCINCGETREGSPYLRKCLACGYAATERKRAEKGQKAWRPGGPGRPPLLAQQG